MAIVTIAYYTGTYLGEPIATEDFPRAEARAERAIAQITHGRATEATFAALPSFMQTAVKNAICAQIEYYAINGTDISINGEVAGGWTTGKVTVQASARVSANPGATMIAASVYAILEQTGLLDPSVGVLDMPPLAEPFPWWGV